MSMSFSTPYDQCHNSSFDTIESPEPDLAAMDVYWSYQQSSPDRSPSASSPYSYTSETHDSVFGESISPLSPLPSLQFDLPPFTCSLALSSVCLSPIAKHRDFDIGDFIQNVDESVIKRPRNTPILSSIALLSENVEGPQKCAIGDALDGDVFGSPTKRRATNGRCTTSAFPPLSLVKSMSLAKGGRRLLIPVVAPLLLESSASVKKEVIVPPMCSLRALVRGPRFAASGPVSVQPTRNRCLSVHLDYHGYTGDIKEVVINDAITNWAMAPHSAQKQLALCLGAAPEEYELTRRVEFRRFRKTAVRMEPGLRKPSSEVPLTIALCVLQRQYFVRDISSIFDKVTLVCYIRLRHSGLDAPYEPQYYRYEVGEAGQLVGETKCGMCSFCPTVRFFPLKNLCYLAHLSLEHGVYANGFVVPEGRYYGTYEKTTPTGTKQVWGIQCPACFEPVEVGCSKLKANPLLTYFRHFKKRHTAHALCFTSSDVAPLKLGRYT